MIVNSVRQQRISKWIAIFFATLLLVNGCSFFETWLEKKVDFPIARLDIKVLDIPAGQVDLNSAKLITIADSKSLKKDGTNIRIPETSSPNASLIAAEFGGEIRLLDYFVTGVRKNPKLSYESTARSLIFMHPLFAGLAFDKRLLIFEHIALEPKFKELVKLVSETSSLYDKKIADLSTEIVISLAKSKLKAANPQPQAASPQTPSSSPSSQVQPQGSGSIFDNVKFPQPACGDPLPSDPKAYPLNLYPVYVEFSEANLQKVKTRYCQDSLPIKKDGKQLIQVASFLNTIRANAFRDLMLKQIGNGEVGKPTAIPEKRSSLDSDSKYSSTQTSTFLDWLFPPAQAQSAIAQATSSVKLEYSVAKDFENKDIISLKPISNREIEAFQLHDIQIKVDPEGIRLTGSTTAALQVLVFPSGKYSNDLTWAAFKNGGTLESDIIYEKLILPDVQMNEVVKPKSGEWKAGKYDVIMSPHLKFARKYVQDGTGIEFSFGAFQYNLATILANTLTTIDGGFSLLGSFGVTDTRGIVSKIALKLPPVMQSCLPKLEGAKQDILLKLKDCLNEPDNLRNISSSLGIGEDKLVAFGLNMQYGQNASLNALLGQIAGGGFAVYDMAKSVSSSILINEQFARDVQKGSWIAQFEAKEPPPDPVIAAFKSTTDLSGFQTVNLDCRKESSGTFFDVEFKSCTGYSDRGSLPRLFEGFFRDSYKSLNVYSGANYRNYSSSWFEFVQEQPFSVRLITPNKEGNWENFKGYSDRMQEKIRQKDENPILSIRIRRLDNLPTQRNINVSCGDKALSIWGIKFEPKCKPSGGIYLEVVKDLGENMGSRDYIRSSIRTYGNVTNMSDRGYIESTSSSVSLDIVFVSIERRQF